MKQLLIALGFIILLSANSVAEEWTPLKALDYAKECQTKASNCKLHLDGGKTKQSSTDCKWVLDSLTSTRSIEMMRWTKQTMNAGMLSAADVKGIGPLVDIAQDDALYIVRNY